MSLAGPKGPAMGVFFAVPDSAPTDRESMHVLATKGDHDQLTDSSLTLRSTQATRFIGGKA